MLHGEARQFSGGRKVLELERAGDTVAEVLERAGIPLGETAAYVVNGEQCDLADAVRDGDTVEVLPAISGGAR